MTVPAPSPSSAAPAKTSAARTRLAAAAAELFYAEGIHTVGIDRLIAAAGVTKATFYRHFPAKDDLVVAYLRGRDATIRAGVEQAAAALPGPGDALKAMVEGLGTRCAGTASGGARSSTRRRSTRTRTTPYAGWSPNTGPGSGGRRRAAEGGRAPRSRTGRGLAAAGQGRGDDRRLPGRGGGEGDAHQHGRGPVGQWRRRGVKGRGGYGHRVRALAADVTPGPHSGPGLPT